MKKFKLNDANLRQMAENAKLTQPLEEVENVLTLNYLCGRLLLAYQLDVTYKDISDGNPVAELKKQIVELIKEIEL